MYGSARASTCTSHVCTAAASPVRVTADNDYAIRTRQEEGCLLAYVCAALGDGATDGALAGNAREALEPCSALHGRRGLDLRLAAHNLVRAHPIAERADVQRHTATTEAVRRPRRS